MYSDKKNYYLLLIASLVTIITVTIYPFNFVLLQQLSWREISNKFHNLTNIKDYVRNIILFVPFGVAWAGIIEGKKYYRWQIIILSLLLSGILSTNIELIQVLLPSRTSSFSDVACNSLGGLLGASLSCWHRDFEQLINATISRKYQQINLKFLATIIISYCAAIICAFSLFFNHINLNNWNNNAYLSLASEVTGQIFWRGYITSLDICDRSIDGAEINNAFNRTHSFFARLPNLITSFTFLDYQPFYANSDRQPLDLYWHQELSPQKINSTSKQAIDSANIDRRIHHQKTVLFEKKNSLISAFPATELNQKIKASQEFTLNIILATNKLKQVGPSRIISLGENIYSRNIMLGQEDSNLIFRLRTSSSGVNATQPSFYIPNFFKDKELHQILITFTRNKLTFYLDRPEERYTFTFQPSNHLKLFLPWIFQKWNVNLQNHNLLQSQITFYSLILFPLILLSCIFILSLMQKIHPNS